MQNMMLWLLTLLLLCSPMPLRAEKATDAPPPTEWPWGTYVFEKQLYMNPLSSFLAQDGMKEYYKLSEDGLMVLGLGGILRWIPGDWQAEPVDVQAFESSFMIPEDGIPEINRYKEKRLYTLISIVENVLYRVYVLDGDVWLAEIHRDSVNTQKQEYVWSIYRIIPYAGPLPGETTPAP